MPIPISRLFLKEDDNIHGMPRQKDVIEMSKGWPYINVSLEELPRVNYPEFNSKELKEDITHLKDCYYSPICDNDFLEKCHKKPFSIFRDYVEANNLDYDMDKLDKINEDLASLVLNLKYMYNRPRPKKFFKVHDIHFPYDDVKDSNTPSYPSGHAAHAFFNAEMISKQNPQHEMRLKILAEMVSQSRIDLGVHFPSDVQFGRFIGEYCSSKCLDKKSKIQEVKVMSKNDSRQARDVFRHAMKRHASSNHGTTYLDELCEFIIRSNQIERYTVDHRETELACESFLNGLPVEYCSNDNYIKSHLRALEAAAHCGEIDTPSKVQFVHNGLGIEVLERGEPGIFRDYDHYARSTGYQYTLPKNIPSTVNDWCSTHNDDKFERHILYECIHPFSDGNGRSGRIILCCDMGFDFAAVNDMIGSDYIPKIVAYQ